MILGYAVRRGYLPKNSAADIKKPSLTKREVTMPETDEVRDLPDAFTNRGVTVDELFVLTAVHTGMRAGELCGLRVRAQDFRRNEVAVRETVVDEGGTLLADTPKNHRTRILHDVSPTLMARLANFTGAIRPGNYVFENADRPLRYGNWDGRVFDVVRRSVGLPNLRFHDLRHFHASLLIDAGHSPVAVAERLGHPSPTVTMDVYAHQFKRRDGHDRASAALDAALAPRTDGNVVPIVKAAG